MKRLEELIRQAQDMVRGFRAAGLQVDAAAARIRLQALLDAKEAMRGSG